MKGTSWLWTLLVAATVAGVVLRFVNLDRKPYWHDEAFISMRLAGYREMEIRLALPPGRDLTPAEVQQFQHCTPGRTVLDTLFSVACNDAQLGPLYYVLARGWVEMAGDSICALRLLSALLSLLTFPCLYWLCRELFPARSIGRIALALLAVSPFHLLYAQEAKGYALWLVTFLFSTAALLRALRLPTRENWALYFVSVAVTLLAFLFSGVVIVVHALYVFLTQSRSRKSFLLAAGTGLACTIPWYGILYWRWHDFVARYQWLAQPVDLPQYLRRFIGGCGVAFVDAQPDPGNLVAVIAGGLSLVMVGVAVWQLIRHTPRTTWWLVVLLLLLPPLLFLLQDAVGGGHRALVYRYLTPTYIAAAIAVAHLLARLAVCRFGWLATVVLLAGGLFSEAVIVQAPGWWNKGFNRHDRVVAQLVNESRDPVILFDLAREVNFGNLLSLSHGLAPHVRLRVRERVDLAAEPLGLRDVFVYYPPESLLPALVQQDFAPVPAVPNGLLWKLKRQ